jgi:hypothetical protein
VGKIRAEVTCLKVKATLMKKKMKIHLR